MWAKRLLASANRSDAERIADAYGSAFGRAPEDWELREALAFLKEAGVREGVNGEEDAWTALCHTWFNVKEFSYVN
jgi:hypothetical protein